MTDDEIADFLGFPADEPRRLDCVKALPAAKRELFERMAIVEIELKVWEAGLGPCPAGILIDTVKSTKRRKAWR